ncbi:MAG: GGDEF domain-containing protein [Rhodobacteraceae bacterium]|nr:GGDEF domain-containing protein [Paracoccaceae bacterium]
MSELCLDTASLDTLMPILVLLGGDGAVRVAGSTLTRVLGRRSLEGMRFSDLFAVRRPRNLGAPAVWPEDEPLKLLLDTLAKPTAALKGVAVHLPDGSGWLINLSFGIAVVDAVRDFDLTSSDFAPTDLAVEMLYLVEAKSLAMEESRKLNRRLERARSAAEARALTDPLTGLGNRRAMDRALEAAIEAGRPFALVQIDLDFFKRVNDSLGHGAGDHVLQVVARILRRETRQGDQVARIGGDEFMILADYLTDFDQLEKLGQRIISELEQPITWDGQPCRISGSLGAVVSTSYVPPDPDRMLRDCDAALYVSKEGGRGRVSFGGPGLRTAPVVVDGTR